MFRRIVNRVAENIAERQMRRQVAAIGLQVLRPGMSKEAAREAFKTRVRERYGDGEWADALIRLFELFLENIDTIEGFIQFLVDLFTD